MVRNHDPLAQWKEKKKSLIKMVKLIPLGTADYFKSHPLSLQICGAIL